MLNLNKRSDELDMWYSAKSSEVRLSVLCCNVGCMQKQSVLLKGYLVCFGLNLTQTEAW